MSVIWQTDVDNRYNQATTAMQKLGPGDEGVKLQRENLRFPHFHWINASGNAFTKM